MTANLNLSTTTSKRGKLGLGKEAPVISTARNLTIQDKAEFITIVSQLVEEAKANQQRKQRAYARTNARRFASAWVRASEKVATLERALEIAKR